MKIAIGCDHGGFEKKREIVTLLGKLGHGVADMGCHSEESCDYPDYAKKVAQAVANKQADRGILVCGTGIGMSIAANKVPGIRAAMCWNAKVASLTAEHNNSNVLCLSGRFFSSALIKSIVKSWLSATFAGGRHETRIQKIQKLETCK